MEAAARLGVRKGAWTEEEDLLLKKCVEKFGEGKWSQVPVRAGLNRCRKSCRLRWVSYLKPNIKRGNFSGDEIDMMIRLHKLLGNRWSLIAGRLPGRTANDVKNYWNKYNHLRKKTIFESQEFPKAVEMESKVIRPQPWTFSRARPSLSQTTNLADTIRTGRGGGGGGAAAAIPSPTSPAGDGGESWWDTIVADMEEMDSEIAGWLSVGGGFAEAAVVGRWDDETEPPIWSTEGSSIQEESKSDWIDIFMGNGDLWEHSQLTNSTQVGDDEPMFGDFLLSD